MEPYSEKYVYFKNILINILNFINIINELQYTDGSQYIDLYNEPFRITNLQTEDQNNSLKGQLEFLTNLENKDPFTKHINELINEIAELQRYTILNQKNVKYKFDLSDLISIQALTSFIQTRNTAIEKKTVTMGPSGARSSARSRSKYPWDGVVFNLESTPDPTKTFEKLRNLINSKKIIILNATKPSSTREINLLNIEATLYPILISKTEHLTANRAQVTRINEILQLFAKIGDRILSLDTTANSYLEIQKPILSKVLNQVLNTTSKAADQELLESVQTHIKNHIASGHKVFYDITAIPSFSAASNSRYIITNGGIPNDNPLYQNTIGCISSIVDAASKIHGGVDATHEDKEIGKMNIKFVDASNPDRYYTITLDPTKLNAEQFPRSKLIIEIKNIIDNAVNPINITIDVDNIRSLSAASRYKKVLSVLLGQMKMSQGNYAWEKLTTDNNFISEFIEAYHPKSSGDFLQELTAILKGGGYDPPPPVPSFASLYSPSSNILKFDKPDSDPFRIYAANDGPSAVRYMFLKLLKDPDYPTTQHPKINQNSYGGYKTSANTFMI